MKQMSRQTSGIPINNTSGYDWRYAPGCGGYGATACVIPAAYSYMYWAIDVTKFSQRNTRLVLMNESFQPYSWTNSPLSPCQYTKDQPQAMTLYVLYDEPKTGISPNNIASSIVLAGVKTPPYELIFDAHQLPQPDDVRYKKKIWIALDFGVAGRMTDGLPQQFEAMKTIKLNWEGTL